MSLSTYLARHRPARPNPEVGLTCPFNQHGRMVYVTRGEHLVMSVLPWASFGLLFTAIAIRASNPVSK
jgi:hypothetical protein